MILYYILLLYLILVLIFNLTKYIGPIAKLPLIDRYNEKLNINEILILYGDQDRMGFFLFF
jgi:hypothetical protein